MHKPAALTFLLWIILTILPLQALAQDTNPGAVAALPTPPELYAQTAVLMDADTGQVVWGKNMHTQMYPASLTKVVTCLLAMEKGNPKDIVTMTDEGVFTVPRGTTHAALTTGERLTLEQLEYAMMVESANDAANGIAIHLAGSIEKFAALMNQKAAELGAADTHFTNANGLPDPAHYTSAYDLGLFTRAALTYPEFRSLAGTRQYIIPPTNLQKEARKFSNRQYMFCLNDTYPGAFAGKTGWTEEAGKTLITIAERDGVTLIAVVLKAAGEVDAEFKDSTALLDYGFDNFQRVNVRSDKVPKQTVDGTGQVLTLEQDIPVLLPMGVGTSALTFRAEVKSAEDAYITLLAPGLSEAMADEIGRYPLSVKALEADTLPAPAVEKPSAEFHISEEVLNILKWTAAIGGILLSLGTIAVMALHRLAVAKQRRRQKLAAAKKRAIQRMALEKTDMERRYRQGPSIIFIDLTKDKNRKNGGGSKSPGKR